MPDRALSVTTPLGEDVLLFRRMTAHEPIGRPFEFTVDLLSSDLGVSAAQLLGRPMTVKLEMEDGEVRFFNGLVTRFAHLGWEGGFAWYQATLRPWLWFLTRKSDCRIFPDKTQTDTMTTPDVIKEVFRLNGFSDFEDKLGESNYFTWEYCVQYRETDFNFVSRLMEQAGIYYYFRHEEDKHILVLCDGISGHEANPHCKNLPYRIEAGASAAAESHVSHWAVHSEAQPGAYALRDYNFEDPGGDMEAVNTMPASHERADLEIYDYPGEYVQLPDGQEYAKVRMEELVAQYERVHGVTTARGFATGTLFNLYRHPTDSQNREYLVLGTTIVTQAEEYESGSGGKGGPVFTCSFEAIDSQVTYRPPRVTPKPVVQGPHTATVVGPPGAAIWTDEFLRVKVKFHWDRHNQADDNASRWCRVSQFWAGPEWGSQHLPHVGQEVIVEFLEGDPDQPIVTGRVYNADNMPMLAVPGKQTQSGYRDHGGNEDVWEGEAGSQWMHRQQTCGNEFKMDGSSGAEKIELRDKYGNEMIMDAVAGTITLHSPTHETKMVMGQSFNLFSLSDYIKEIKGNENTVIALNAVKSVVGDFKVDIGGNMTDLFLGWQNKTVIGFVGSIIGGWKRETITGAETKTVRGVKSEVIKGLVYKQHVGHTYKDERSDEKQKAPGVLRMLKDLRSIAKEEKRKIEAGWEVNIGSRAMMKAQSIIEKCEKIVNESSDNNKVVGALVEIEAQEDKIKAEQTYIKASQAKIEASETAIKSIVKLG